MATSRGSQRPTYASTALSVFVALAVLPAGLADLPVHCLLQDVAGEWVFHVGPPQPSAFADARATIPSCGHHVPNNVLSMLALNETSVVSSGTQESFHVQLTETIAEEPTRRLVADAQGTLGGWTMMFDEGFEVRLSGNESSPGAGRSFFAHFRFDALPNSTPANGDRWTNIAKYYGRQADQIKLAPEGTTYECHCDQTSTGWWHRPTASGGLESGCFWAQKLGAPQAAATNLVRLHQRKALSGVALADASGAIRAGSNASLGAAIWDLSEIAQRSKVMEKEVIRPVGAPTPRSAALRTLALINTSSLRGVKQLPPLPKNWDWRKQLAAMSPDGVDDLSEQFDQGNCGSCYAFSGAQVLQMRFRIRLFQKYGVLYPLELSWRSATQCSPYTEGCNGGFAYLTFKYAAEVGLPLSECDAQVDPQQLDNECKWGCYRNNSMLFYAKDYGQTGGFCNGASEESIMREIHDRGPVIMSFATGAAPEFIYNNGRSAREDTEVMTVFDNSKVPQENSSQRNPSILPWRYTTHSILAVGFGEEKAPDGSVNKYWIVRNSWGQGWGTNGYAKMRRGHNDAALETSAPWVEPDMDRLPAGFLERARKYHNEHEATRAKVAKATAEKVEGQAEGKATETASTKRVRGSKKMKGGRPEYCKLRPDSPDCK